MQRITTFLATLLVLGACADQPTAPGATSPRAPADVTIEPAGGSLASATRVDAEGDYYCTTTVTGSFENVIVPEGATCTLSSAQVSGNILAKDGSRLFVYETTTGGNIDGAEAAVLHVRGGRLEGSIQAQDGRSPTRAGVRIFGGTILTQGNITIQKMNTGTISITDARLLKGNIQVQENTTVTRLELLRNTVAQNLEVFNNSGAGAKFVTGNRVQQKLSCKENQAPFTGSPNTAGDVEGQCSR